MEKEVYYAVLDGQSEEGYFFENFKIFKYKRLAEIFAQTSFLKIWKEKLNRKYGGFLDVDEIQVFLSKNNLLLNKNTSDEELLRLYQLLKVKLEDDEDNYFFQEMLSVEIIEVPINK